MAAIESDFPLPEAAILKVADKYKPTIVAHFHGGDLMVAIGALSNPLTLVAFRQGGKTDVVSYPHRPWSDEVYAELREHRRANQYDGDQDWYSRDLAASPRQLLTVGDALVLVRLHGGHALIDPSTLAIETVPRSAVEQSYRFGPDTLVVGACGKYANAEPVQLFWTYDAARVREPLVRYRVREPRHPEDRIVDGTPFPDEEGDIPFAGGIARLRGTSKTFDNSMHVASAISWQGKLFGFALGLHRSFSDEHSLIRIDFASRKVDRFRVLAKEDKTLRATFAPSAAGLIAFADKAVLMIDPETLAVTDRAPLPKGIRLVGSDEERLILHHKRGNTLFVVRNTAFAPPLGSALAAVEAEIDGVLKASRAAAKRKRA
jgi:hypothetical protein